MILFSFHYMDIVLVSCLLRSFYLNYFTLF
nr:MAG TPA: hypothetical protein [Caudoviricetes sp.]